MRRLLAAFLVLWILLQFQPATLVAQAKSAAERLSRTDHPNLEGLEEFITSAMSEWKVPGLAISVVKDGKVILSKGYGLRDVKNDLPVTARTLFAIGSVTKSFTVTALWMLADEDKIDWDQPARTYLPDFQLYDKVATDHMTPRDLVTHRSGLPRHDGLWYGSNFTRKEMYDRLRYLEPSKELRSSYQYQNLMFMTAGYLAGQIADTTWEEFIRQRIFEPLSMSDSNFSVNDSQQSDDFALPYRELQEEVRLVSFRNIDEIGPAGSINSNVEEMIRYVQLHIRKGRHRKTRLISRMGAEQMQTPQMVIPGRVQHEELGHSSYGMGFVVTTYRGHKLLQHGGGIDGFTALLSFMPRKKMGMIILTNLSGNPVPTIVSRNVYDRLLELDQVDWVGRTKEQEKKSKQAREEANQKGYTTRKEGTSPSHMLAEYAGKYEHPGYGLVKIELEDSHLRITFNEISSQLEHFHYDIFEIPKDPLGRFDSKKATFFYNKTGDIDRLAIPLEPRVSDIVFRRVADESMKQRSFLEPLVGEYELGPTTVTIALEGDSTITLTVPGRPTYKLVPARGTSFNLKGLNDFSVEFKKDTSGAVTELVIYQPNGTFVCKRKSLTQE